MGAQVAVIKVFSGPERPAFKMVAHMAVGRKPWFLATFFSTGLLSTRLLITLRDSILREIEEAFMTYV